MTTRRKSIAKEKTPAESEPVVHDLLPVGQQVTIIQEFKGPRGMIRVGSNSVVEGCEVSGDKSRYKILYRGFRFWVPAQIVEPREV